VFCSVAKGAFPLFRLTDWLREDCDDCCRCGGGVGGGFVTVVVIVVDGVVVGTAIGLVDEETRDGLTLVWGDSVFHFFNILT